MAIRRIPIFLDAFNDGSQDLPVLSGNGSVSESGGALVISATAGQNMDWYTFGRNGKSPYVGVPLASDYLKVYYEFTLKSWTTTDGNYSHLVTGPMASDTSLWFLWTNNGTSFNVYRNWGTGSLGSITTTLPRKFRFIWDVKNSTMDVQCQTGISPIVWTSMVTGQAASMTPVRFNFGIKNWNYFPACSAQFEDVEIYAEDFSETTTDPSGLEDDANLPEQGDFALSTFTKGNLNSDDTGLASGFEDEGGFVPVAGNNQNVEGIGLPGGQLVQEPEGFEDETKFPSAGGIPDYVTGVPEGARTTTDPSGFEDSNHLEALTPTYVNGLNDADGRSFLGDTAVYHLQAYETTGEPWATPVPGNGFYGAGRDGKFYYDGNECGPTLNGTTFGTLAGGFNGKTWMTDVEPSAIQANIINMAMAMVSDDHVTINSIGALSAWEGKYFSSRHRWCLVGDFDIEVRYENRNASGGSDGNCPSFSIQVDDSNQFYVRRHHNNLYDSDVQINGGYVSYASAATTDTYGRLRIVRSGTSITTYYWNNAGSAWVTLHGAYSNAVLGKPCTVIMGAGGTGSFTITRVDIFGFAINSGTVVNTAGWARETAGTYRGSRSDFPEKAVLSASRYAIDIIDRNNNKLWMRFVAGSNNAMHQGTIPCRRVSMRNGVLMVAYQTGGTICIDFTTDDIRLHSAAAETWTGSILRAYNGVYWGAVGSSGRDCGPVGIIACRNLAGGYSGDNNNWQVPGTTVYDTDLFEASGYLYKAHATVAGMGGHKWRRWYNNGSTPSNWWAPGVGKSAETDTMYWCQIADNGDLFYMSTTTIYSADFATWDAKVGGALQTWTADYSKTLPGTFAVNTPQNRAAIIGSDVFVPANEGVYRCAWPSGAFALAYGWGESGAMYPILGWNPRLARSVRTVYDNLGTPLLAIGVEWLHGNQVWSQIVLVNPSTNTVYGVSPALKARTVQSMAV